MHIPATSSITTRLLSFPHSPSTPLADHTPISVMIKDNNSITPLSIPAGISNKAPQQAAAATVPPPFRWPMPKQEAIIL